MVEFLHLSLAHLYDNKDDSQSETKTDINFDNETERKYKGYSIKAGSTGQLHQVGPSNKQFA